MTIGAWFDRSRYGATFRLWAPAATAVEIHVRASDATWTSQRAMVKGTNEYWEDFAPGVLPGSQYTYVLHDAQGRRHERLDPAARDTISSALSLSANAGIVIDPAWTWPPFATPRFEDLIIYQLHVGAFSGRNDHCQTWPARFPDVETKLQYIRDLGFNAIEFLPVQEFCLDRSWGYNPAFFFAPETGYGSPLDLRRLVDAAHRRGLAVLFDLVFNHAADADNSLWGMDVTNDRGIYLQAWRTPWGHAPAYWKDDVRAFFVDNAEMYFGEYGADGLRFDATRYIEEVRGLDNDGWQFLQHLTYTLKQAHPDKLLIAEHLPDHETIVTSAGFRATWCADAHHEFQRAMDGNDPVGRLTRIAGKDVGDGRRYPNAWNLVKYLLGSHDDCGDDKGGATLGDAEDWKRHRYFVEFFGGRSNWYARAKARLGWALSVACMGTPMLFMGDECHMWGYWHDSEDGNGDHRFDWSIAGDPVGMDMRRLVAAANQVRWSNPCLRGEDLAVTHEDRDNGVLAFKRWLPGQGGAVLVVANCGDRSFRDHEYGVRTGGQPGRWTQILCTQDAEFGGWDGAGNAFYEPSTEADGSVYINLPEWGVVMLRLND